MNLPLNHHPDLIKCEPEIIIKHDSIQCSNSNLQHTPEADSEGDSMGAEAEPNGSCNMTEGMNNNLQMQEIRSDILIEPVEEFTGIGTFMSKRLCYLFKNCTFH